MIIYRIDIIDFHFWQLSGLCFGLLHIEATIGKCEIDNSLFAIQIAKNYLYLSIFFKEFEFNKQK